MDRTKKLKLARYQYKKNARKQQTAEEESQHYDQLIADIKEKVEATRAAKARSAESRRLLEELQSELAEEEENVSDTEHDPPVSKSEIGALVASSIQSSVSFSFWHPFYQ